MNLEQAKQELIDNAIGHNEYHTISDWEQLKEAAEHEQMFASDRVRSLGGLVSLANSKT